MKAATLFMFILVSAVVLQHSDAGPGWVRKVWRWVTSCGNICKTRVCTITRTQCQLQKICTQTCKKYCKRVKKFFGKRDEIGESFIKDSFETRAIVQHPSALSAYDMNKDGRISRDEFRAVTKAESIDEPSFKMAFDLMDKDGDGSVNCDEFKKAMLDFDAVEQTC